MGNVKRKSRGVCAVEWLTIQFQKQTAWESDELHKAAREAGVSRSSLWSDEVNALPIQKRRRVNADGQPCWFWIAEGNWPPVVKKDETNKIVETVDTQSPF